MSKQEDFRTLDVLSKIIANHYNVEESYMFQYNRKRQVIDVRKVFFYFAREHTKLSLEAIGSYCGTRNGVKSFDHSTVLHLLKTVDDTMSVDKKYSLEIEELSNKIKFFVDYEQYCSDQSDHIRKDIVETIYKENNPEFLLKYRKFTEIVKENMEILDLFCELAESRKYLELNLKNNVKGIHKTSSEDFRLGVV